MQNLELRIFEGDCIIRSQGNMNPGYKSKGYYGNDQNRGIQRQASQKDPS
jgi:hypothetical protein